MTTKGSLDSWSWRHQLHDLQDFLHDLRVATSCVNSEFGTGFRVSSNNYVQWGSPSALLAQAWQSGAKLACV
jgi:hypothetical protein